MRAARTSICKRRPGCGPSSCFSDSSRSSTSTRRLRWLARVWATFFSGSFAAGDARDWRPRHAAEAGLVACEQLARHVCDPSEELAACEQPPSYPQVMRSFSPREMGDSPRENSRLLVLFAEHMNTDIIPY